MNALSPERMSGDERLAELAGILAAGLRRLKRRTSSSFFAECGESSLDGSPGERGHVSTRNRRRSA